MERAVFFSEFEVLGTTFGRVQHPLISPVGLFLDWIEILGQGTTAMLTGELYHFCGVCTGHPLNVLERTIGVEGEGFEVDDGLVDNIHQCILNGVSDKVFTVRAEDTEQLVYAGRFKSSLIGAIAQGWGASALDSDGSHGKADKVLAQVDDGGTFEGEVELVGSESIRARAGL
jgi:hypothetical protein